MSFRLFVRSLRFGNHWTDRILLLGYIHIGPVMVLSYFLGGLDTPNPQKMKIPPSKKKFWGNYFT